GAAHLSASLFPYTTLFRSGEAVAMFFAVHALRHYSSLPFEAESTSALSKFYLNMPGDIRDRIDEMKNRVDFITPTRRGEAPCLRSEEHTSELQSREKIVCR